MEVNAEDQQTHPETDHSDLFASFSTPGQPVTDTVLKDMLLSLRSSLQADMLTCLR